MSIPSKEFAVSSNRYGPASRDRRNYGGFAKLLLQKSYLGEITYDLKDPAFCFTIVKKPDDFCSLTAHLAKLLSEIEKCKVQKLDEMFNLAHFALKECRGVYGCSSPMHTQCIQKRISEYFCRVNNVHPEFSFKSPQSRKLVFHKQSDRRDLQGESMIFVLSKENAMFPSYKLCDDHNCLAHLSLILF
ncbi:hypothetical protein M5K25_003904 [Dendrobium thyrsiflorum]|uniref:Uncharacterized protein n=1 Tax=Dendrobium thyrsiflorum TaxID=117978 RepID=A0ABD0VS72_DENTH